MGQAKHLDPGSRAAEGVQHRAETERLVIGMGYDRQH